MDAFGYNVAVAAHANGYNAPLPTPEDNVVNPHVDGYSPFRVELCELISRLRARYGRRKGFRIIDVQNMIDQIRREKARVDRRLEFGIAPTPDIDLTEVDNVIE